MILLWVEEPNLSSFATRFVQSQMTISYPIPSYHTENTFSQWQRKLLALADQNDEMRIIFRGKESVQTSTLIYHTHSYLSSELVSFTLCPPSTNILLWYANDDYVCRPSLTKPWWGRILIVLLTLYPIKCLHPPPAFTNVHHTQNNLCQNFNSWLHRIHKLFTLHQHILFTNHCRVRKRGFPFKRSWT